ncbi:hypothetical protein CCAN2_1140005 [Capnocytophaga canimorsus]|uniref:Transmembrane protein n=1 Tax=Capnocytophaga canimorsus TaxID=28188 RepID=A0A0B7I9Z6_9FLAO|nr:hypothetical protein CCAN2_1140005 [Capnocytophaga canimorsus]CEN46678.1 hypothetical protein CCAN11_1150006 [Capnocytophaga canimorsus]
MDDEGLVRTTSINCLNFEVISTKELSLDGSFCFLAYEFYIVLLLSVMFFFLKFALYFFEE